MVEVSGGRVEVDLGLVGWISRRWPCTLVGLLWRPRDEALEIESSKDPWCIYIYVDV